MHISGRLRLNIRQPENSLPDRLRVMYFQGYKRGAFQSPRFRFTE